MTNCFSYNKKNTLKSIKTIVDLFGRKSIGKIRLEYLNNNVSKVYSSKDNVLEKLSFTGDVYDGQGRLNQETKKEYEYNKVGLPVISDAVSLRNGKKFIEVWFYNFGCK